MAVAKPEKSYSQRIKTAHESGHLFAHMFEGSLEEDGLELGKFPLKNLFDVMARKKDAQYCNAYDHEFHMDPNHGVVGLATTALNKEFPVPLYICSSQVGLMMDSAKPIVVNPSDGHTRVNPECVEFGMNREVHKSFKEVFDAQGLEYSPRYGIDTTKNDLSDRFALAEAGLKKMWQCIREVGWGKTVDIVSKDGLNEVNVAANLNDVCGIVVYKTPMRDRHYRKAVRAAKELKTYLVTHYPEFFNDSLPIVSYELSRAPEMTELDEKEIESVITSKRSRA